MLSETIRECLPHAMKREGHKPQKCLHYCDITISTPGLTKLTYYRSMNGNPFIVGKPDNFFFTEGGIFSCGPVLF